MKYKLITGYKLLSERKEIKPTGKFIVPPPFKYTIWDFIKDIFDDINQMTGGER